MDNETKYSWHKAENKNIKSLAISLLTPLFTKGKYKCLKKN